MRATRRGGDRFPLFVGAPVVGGVGVGGEVSVSGARRPRLHHAQGVDDDEGVGEVGVAVAVEPLAEADEAAGAAGGGGDPEVPGLWVGHGFALLGTA